MARIVDKIKGISKKVNRIVKRGVVRNRRHTIRMSELADQFDDPNAQLTMRQRITGSVIRATEDAVLGNMGQLGSAWQRARRGDRGYVKLAVKRAVYSATLGRMGYLGSAFEAKWNSRGIIIEEKDLGIPEPSQTSKTTKLKTEDVLKTLQELEDKLQKNFSNINAAFGDIAGDFKKTKEFHETILPKRIEQNIDEKVNPINEMIVTLSRKLDEIDDEKFQLENLSQRVSENESAIAQLRGEIRSELYKKKPEAVENSPVFGTVDPVRRTEGPAGLIPSLLKFFGIGFAGAVGIGAGAVAGGATTAGILATIKRTFTRLGPKKLAQMIGTRMAGAALGGPAAPIIGAIGLGLLAKEIYDATSNSAEAAELVDKDEINLEANRLIKMKSRKIELAADEIVLDAHNIVFKTASKVTFGSPTTKTFSAPKPSIENLEQQQTPIKPVQPVQPPQPMPSLGELETGPIQSDMGIQSTPMQRPGASITQSYGTNGANVPGMISKVSVPENVSAFNPGDVRPGSRYNKINIPYDGRSAAVRYNNPAAQYPSKHAEKFGMEGYGIIGGGHKIAKFPSDAHGAAANMDNFARNYKGLTISQAVRKWRGPNVGNNLIPTGYDPNMVIDDNFLNNQDMMIDFFKKMSKHEGRKGGKPIPDSEWYHAYGMFKAGGVENYKKELAKRGEEVPETLRGNSAQILADVVDGKMPAGSIAVQEALKAQGLHESRDRQAVIQYLRSGGQNLDPKNAWCAAFVNASLARAGIKGSGSDAAGSFHPANFRGGKAWGEAVNDPSKVQPGDVVVNNKVSPRSGMVGSHVWLATGNVDPKTGKIEVVSGNQKNSVMKEWISPKHIGAIRRSPQASMIPQLPEDQQQQSKPEPQQPAIEKPAITSVPKPTMPSLGEMETGINAEELQQPKPLPPSDIKPEELASSPPPAPKFDEAKTNEPPLEFEPTKADDSGEPDAGDYGTDAPTVSAPYYNPESAAPEPGDNGYGEYRRCLV